ncbi:hypothetical protein BD410DRAFT_372584 [Rickenella mellea]|uniref:F-box domain-containing protein n=1 Tax=Rickenella mellea TaxID=50990 RepID=A0A4Y7Q0Z1_9AGAM|nr:hypothetical protein BD410DRAFT_372584 [Rickenella mellea]
MAATRQSTGRLPRTDWLESDADTVSDEEDAASLPTVGQLEECTEIEQADDSLPHTNDDRDECDVLGNGQSLLTGPIPNVIAGETKATWYSGSVDQAVMGEKSKINFVAPKEKDPPTGRRARNQGKLAFFMALPFDIFCEIAGHVTPQDILHLSWSSQSLRSLLMSKRSRPIWRAAQTNMGLPDCPPDICEPHYAKLVFGRECHVCEAPKTYKVDFAMRVRLCDGCMKLNTVKGCTLAERYGKDLVKDVTIYKMVPFHKSALNNETILDAHMSRKRFYKPDFERALEQYVLLAQNPAARAKFVAQREELTMKAIQHAISLNIWVNEKNQNKHETLQSSLMSRKDSIHAKLKELGVTETDLMLNTQRSDQYTQDWNRLVNQTRALTSRIWKMIQPQLENIIYWRKQDLTKEQKAIQLKLRQAEVSAFYNKYLNAMDVSDPEAVFLPNAGDFSRSAMVTNLLEVDCETKVSNERWETFIPILPELFKKYKNLLITQCASAFRNANKNQEPSDMDNEQGANETNGTKFSDDDILRRATSIFQCRSCLGDPLFAYPDVLAHSHSKGHFGSLSYDWIPSGSRLICLDSTLNIAKTLLANLGFAPSTTMLHMQSLGSRYYCQCCDPLLREGFSWMALVGGQIFTISIKGRLALLDRAFQEGEELVRQSYSPRYQCRSGYPTCGRP